MSKTQRLQVVGLFVLLGAMIVLVVLKFSPKQKVDAAALNAIGSDADPDVILSNSGFSPAQMDIQAGMSVAFHNETDTSYTLIGFTIDAFPPYQVYLPLVAKSSEGTSNEVHAQTPVRLVQGSSSPDSCAFQIPFPHGAVYVHEYTHAGICGYSLVDTSENGYVRVNDASGPATLTGRLLDTTSVLNGDQGPIVGATVSLLGTAYSAVSDANGYFTIANITPPGAHVLDISTTDAQPAPDGSPYASFREEFFVIGGMTNTVERPFYLPRIDPDSLTTVIPSQTTTVNNPNLDITMSVPPYTARNEDGTPFTGQLSISEVPQGLAPAMMPPELQSGLLITVQPVGVSFDTPAPITFPNFDNLAVGNELDLWSLDPETGSFVVVGTGEVVQNGSETEIQIIEGGIRAADWHFFLPPFSQGSQPEKEDNDNDCNKVQEEISSNLTLHDGCLGTSFSLPSYRSLGANNALTFVYKADQAYPQIILPFEMTIPQRAAVPPKVSYQLSVSGINWGDPTYLDTSGLSESQDETVRGTVTGDTSYLATGAYPYNIQYTSHYASSQISSNQTGRTIVVNDQDNPVGAGWNIAGISKLHHNTDGTILLVSGNGSAQVFSPAPFELTNWTVEGPAGNGNWVVSPDGKSVTQSTIDGGQSFFVSTDSFINTTIRGTFRVNTASDDDFIGVVFGYQSPLNANGDQEFDNNFLLFDWKQITQTSITGYVAQEGFSLSNAHGIIPTGTEFYKTFWSHSNTPEFTVLDTDFRDDNGWLDFTDYNFELLFETNRIRITINDQEIFDVAGSFSPGRLGFYICSQREVIFSNFSSSAETERFIGPEGDFSTLIKDELGNYARRLPDGTEYHFSPTGLQTSMVDRNGNTTTYTYDANDRLTTITDPAGIVNTFTYTDGLLTNVTNPGGTTTFQHDAQGNLTTVTFPDGSGQTFGYDPRHLMTSETDTNGNLTQRTYNAFGQLTNATLPGGVIRATTASQLVGWVPPGSGTETDPAPITRPEDALSTFIDGEGHTTTFVTGQFGEATQITDPAGFITSFTRDSDGNPTQTTIPSGAVFDRTFDDQGNLLTFTDQTLGGTTTFTYEPVFNQITTLTNPFNQTTDFTYDANGNLTQITTPLNRTVTFSYDDRGLVTNLTDPLGTLTAYTYNAQGNLTALAQGTGPDQRTASLTYTSAGYVETLTDPLARLFSFGYDDLGRLLSETLPGDRTIAYTYDDAGNLLTLTPPGRPAHTFTYTGLNLLETYTAPAVTGGGTNQTTYTYNDAQQLTLVTRPDNLTLAYAYDAFGRLTGLTIPRGTLGYTYSPTTGQVTSITDPGGVGLTYTYDGEVLTNITWSGLINGNVGYTYDEGARLEQLNINGTPYTFAYDHDDALTQAGALTLNYNATTSLLTGTTLGGITDSWTFNAFAELSGYSAAYNAANVFDATYTRDKFGRITQKVETVDGVTETWDYTYDAAGRLATVTLNGGQVVTYSYDLNGNRQSDGTNTATYDAQDRLLTYGPNIYTYTPNGELMTKTTSGQTTTYTYDALGNLMAVTLPDTTAITYLVDGEGRRVGKQVNGMLVQGWLYGDALNPVAELAGAGNVVSTFIYASQSNVPDYMVKGGVTYRIISDHLGSVRLVLNAQTGALAQQMNYDAFGRVTQDTNPGFQPFGFAGGLYDPDTGLVRFGARDYDAGVGRWTMKDPIRFAGGDTNLFGYLLNDPVNYIDVNGLGKFCKRPLKGLPIMVNSAVDDYLNTEISHEHYFYDDGTNTGYSDEGRFSEQNPTGYVCSNEEYDDKKIKDAIDAVDKSGDFDANDYKLIGNNCQDWADAVRENYSPKNKSTPIPPIPEEWIYGNPLGD